jgi:hypothetical protein
VACRVNQTQKHMVRMPSALSDAFLSLTLRIVPYRSMFPDFLVRSSWAVVSAERSLQAARGSIHVESELT